MSKGIDKLFNKETSAVSVPPAEPPLTLLPEQTCDLPLDVLVDMEQPFKLYSDIDSEAMRLSIATHGVLQRLLVRPYADGMYQIVAGRNRRNGAKLAGLTTVPCEVRNLSDDDAEIMMIETNLNQRIKILPSERAWAYRKLIEAMKRQGQKLDGCEGGGSDCHKSRDALGASDGLRGRQVQNYIALTNLSEPLMALIDDEKLSIMAGVQFSYLSTENQSVVHDFCFSSRTLSVSEALAIEIRAAGEKKILTEETLKNLITGQGKTPVQRITSISLKPVKKLFPHGTTPKQIQHTTIAALKFYFEHGQSVIGEDS